MRRGRWSNLSTPALVMHMRSGEQGRLGTSLNRLRQGREQSLTREVPEHYGASAASGAVAAIRNEGKFVPVPHTLAARPLSDLHPHVLRCSSFIFKICGSKHLVIPSYRCRHMCMHWNNLLPSIEDSHTFFSEHILPLELQGNAEGPWARMVQGAFHYPSSDDSDSHSSHGSSSKPTGLYRLI